MTDENRKLTNEEEVARLAALHSLDYERVREAEAKRLGIRRVAALDDMVKAARRGLGDKGGTMELPTPEPWSEPVDGIRLFQALVKAFKRYIVMEAGAAELLALWTIFAHAFKAFMISPRLAITSPQKRCGKTLVLEVLSHLVPKPLITANITPAAVFRTIDSNQPVLLIDEADTFLKGNQEMRGILNSGHRPATAFVMRLVGDNHQPRKFSTRCPMAIAMIGCLPGTLADRSIPINLRRKLPRDRVERFRSDRTADLDELARKAARWAADNLTVLSEADPKVPPVLHDRAADNFRPLLAIADVIGGEFPLQVRRIAENLMVGAAGSGRRSGYRPWRCRRLTETASSKIT